MEAGIPMSLIGENGDTIVFNDLTDAGAAGGILFVDDITGLDGAEMRTPTDNRPQRDGLIVHPFYDAGRIITITGLILPTSNVTQGRNLQDRLKAVCNSIKRLDGRYIFTPTGSVTRFLTVRLNDAVQITNESSMGGNALGATSIKRFTITLIAGDPGVYTYAETDTTIASGASASITNAGNVATRKVVAQVFGPYTAFRLTNATTNEYLAFSGVSITAGHYIEIVMGDETAYKDGTGANQLGFLDVANSDFFGLNVGGNTIVFDHVTGGGGTTHVLFKHNSGWA
jgi:hypothetical protein